MKKYSPFIVIKWVFTFGCLLVIPIGYSEFSQINWAMPTIIYWKIIFVVLGTTFLAYLLNIYALKTVAPSVVSTYIYLQPVFATIAAVMLDKDELNPIKILAALFIFIGVYLVNPPMFRKK